MTQEEKFKEAKRLYETANADQKYVLESLFPELKESEDERIRKNLIGYIKGISKNEVCEETKDSWIAWLEKQGEQKPDWSEKDEKIAKTIINEFEQCSEWCCANGLTKEDCIVWLKSLKPQNKWKPSDEQITALSEINLTGYISYAGQGQELINLYNDLKKLRG